MRTLAGLDVAVMSAAIATEYVNVVTRRSVRRLFDTRNVTQQDYLNLVADFRRLSELITPTGDAPPCRDERDRMYLHCAVAGRVDYLVTADDDLLAMQTVESIPIVPPAVYLAVMSPSIREE